MSTRRNAVLYASSFCADRVFSPVVQIDPSLYVKGGIRAVEARRVGLWPS